MLNRSVKSLTKLVLLSIGALVLAGCAQHLSQQQCKTMNWYQMGFKDGSQGLYQRSLAKDIQDCAKYKLTVDTKAYSRGWRAGTHAFCKPSTAYNLGANGMSYNNVCPRNLVKPFNRAWRRGLRKYCVPATGYNLGRSGKPMPGFCAPSQINTFRNAYNTGLREYQKVSNLQGQLGNVNSHIASTQNQIAQQRHYINVWRNKLNAGFPNTPYEARQRKRDRLHRKIRYARGLIRDSQQQINRLMGQRNSLQRQINRVPN